MNYVPSLITTTGLLLALNGFATYPDGSALYWLYSSLLFDVVDGWAARRWRVETVFGSHFDWSVDVAVSHGIALLYAPILSVPLAIAQAMSMSAEVRVSGRAAATLVATIAVIVG